MVKEVSGEYPGLFLDGVKKWYPADDHEVSFWDRFRSGKTVEEQALKRFRSLGKLEKH